MRICMFEDDAVVHLQPLTDTRPAFDLRCGARTLLQRQLYAFSRQADTEKPEVFFAFVRPELVDLCRREHPELTVNSLGVQSADKILFINARWLPPAEMLPPPQSGEVGLCDNQVAYACFVADKAPPLLQMQHGSEHGQEWMRDSAVHSCGGRMITYPWDLLVHHAEALEQDYRHWFQQGAAMPADQLSVVGPRERCLVHPSARIEPLVLIDTTRGPVLIDADAVIQAFSRLEGPCYIGPRTQVLGARLRGTSLGPECRIGGEVEASIVQGYSNKAHEGFLGHSYLGEWVNLGAGTQVSDLRTDYAPVRIQVGGKWIDTGLLKIGAFMGDHVRTSIDALVNTGSVFGPFALLLTSGALLPRYLPAFCRFGHGEIQERNDLRQLFASAATAMSRRGQSWTETHAEFYFDLYERTAEARRRHIRDSEQRRLRRAVG